jgi:hypothetical protein
VDGVGVLGALAFPDEHPAAPTNPTAITTANRPKRDPVASTAQRFFMHNIIVVMLPNNKDRGSSRVRVSGIQSLAGRFGHSVCTAW